MRSFAALTWALACCLPLAETKAVFAHFTVGNTKLFGLGDWQNEIQLAQSAGIDAFALNMAQGDTTNDVALPLAFSAAASLGFQLLFSFDYAGSGPWDKSVIISMINEYGAESTYGKRGQKPLVSTFEGPSNAGDWQEIKAATDCFFIPNWSSVGARLAVKLGGGVADGLFSWDAWPKGPANMTTYPDASCNGPRGILQLAGDDSTSTLNLEKKRKDKRLWQLASILILAGALVWVRC
ncbi:glycoside hydrolase family 71 protein [Parathielavia hyrcaniae]|uniref:Glycoside hydrolase family 71 protein n=1 Tax=Parathielavia hyrcaniae TaxID=113614 RepID=A0AAN6Q3C1_9PEZI|nr:glycoside hydrolase family 71 protein [Parathielavia hyrcaniae]